MGPTLAPHHLSKAPAYTTTQQGFVSCGSESARRTSPSPLYRRELAQHERGRLRSPAKHKRWPASPFTPGLEIRPFPHSAPPPTVCHTQGQGACGLVPWAQREGASRASVQERSLGRGRHGGGRCSGTVPTACRASGCPAHHPPLCTLSCPVRGGGGGLRGGTAPTFLSQASSGRKPRRGLAEGLGSVTSRGLSPEHKAPPTPGGWSAWGERGKHQLSCRDPLGALGSWAAPSPPPSRATRLWLWVHHNQIHLEQGQSANSIERSQDAGHRARRPWGPQ